MWGNECVMGGVDDDCTERNEMVREFMMRCSTCR